MRVDIELLGDVTAGEDLDRVPAGGQALVLQRLGVDLGARIEAVLEVGEVDRLSLGAEVLEGHRGLFVRPAKLSHPHVDRVLATLVARLLLRARAGSVSLVAASGGLAATALAA